MEQLYLTDNADTECAYYPNSKKLVVINNSDRVQDTTVMTEAGNRQFTLQPYETQMMDL
jgi:beta-D-galactosyl-(1->4)-L-rhamnose phosphorylase